MLVPLNWLREFTPYSGSARELGDKLTMLGLELEEIVNPFAAIEGIVVGYVAECSPHPDSDHLHCCKVDLGAENFVDIVCGAPNVAQGQKVAVAPVGCSLPDGTTIKKAKLRGQPSCGMICSERELGLSEDHSGIMVLPDSLVVGNPLVAALDMDTEVLDISITPNRADCLSILGIARETAAAFDLPLNVPELPLIIKNSAPETDVPISIEDPDLCWLYSGRVISGVTVRPSPMRMRHRLMAVGVRPVSNVVDVTNYVMFECGQPLHSFDLDKVDGRRIVVKCAREGQLFTTLDGKERRLTAQDLCICDEKGPIGLAGVMGGLNTEMDAQSKNVFLESAVFRPQNVRKTSRRLGLSSEASYRFERGVDQQRTIWALQRAASLIVDIGGGVACDGFSIQEPRPFIPARIPYRPNRAEKLLGAVINRQFQENALESLGCAVEKNSEDEWTIIQPSWRPDLTRPADLVEETGRVYGLDTIEPKLPAIQRSMNDSFANASNYAFFMDIRKWASGLGLNEAINYSFSGQADLDRLNLDAKDRVAVFNPLSEEQNVLRTCLAPGLLKDLANNLAFGAQSIRLFEIATGFHADEKSQTTVRETPLLGMLLHGLRHEPRWPHKDDELGYTDIKGLLENLLNFLHLAQPHFTLLQEHPWLLPCVQVSIGNDSIGILGRVKPEISHEYNALKDVWMSELNLDKLQQLNAKAIRRFKALPVYPPVRRDMTIIASGAIKIDNILEKMQQIKMPLLEGAVLTDCYQPDNSSERHLTFRLSFRHQGRTLKDAEVDKEREKMAEFLRKQLDVKI